MTPGGEFVEKDRMSVSRLMLILAALPALPASAGADCLARVSRGWTAGYTVEASAAGPACL